MGFSFVIFSFLFLLSLFCWFALCDGLHASIWVRYRWIGANNNNNSKQRKTTLNFRIPGSPCSSNPLYARFQVSGSSEGNEAKQSRNSNRNTRRVMVNYSRMCRARFVELSLTVMRIHSRHNFDFIMCAAVAQQILDTALYAFFSLLHFSAVIAKRNLFSK